tara:strand:- start:85 stop:1263 length:1179 start_codon:yes stop_codon:yes gene_type:complete
MTLQLVLDANGNYVYQDVKTSQSNITSKDFEAYEGDTKTTLATGGTNLGTQTEKLIRELPGTITTDIDPTTGEVTTKGRTQQVGIEQKPMGESAASAVTPINPFDKVQSIIGQTQMSGASAADKERIFKLIQDQQKLNQSAQKFDQVTKTLDMGLRAYNMFSGKNVGTPPITSNITPLTNIGSTPIGSSTLSGVGAAGAIAYGVGTAFKVKPKERTGMTAGASIGMAAGGPVGAVAGAVIGGILGCFLPDTEITMADGSKKKIIDIELKDNIKVGGNVFATAKFLITNLYDYKGVKVSGSHMVNENNKWIRVEDSDIAKSLGNDEHVVYTLGTQNRRIVINDILFTDYFEIDEKEELVKQGDSYFDTWKLHSDYLSQQNVYKINEKQTLELR